MSETSIKCRFSKFRSSDSTREFDGYSNAGNKRLFSNRESKQLDRSSKVIYHCDKRQRPGSWLLAPLHSRCNQARSYSKEKVLSTQCCSPIPRVSKFVEGSMHDRVSQRPPMTYLDVDESSLQECQFLNQNPTYGIPRADQSESRNSMLKIRKSLVSSLNLSNWKIWSKDHDSKKCEENAKRRLMNERQEKAKNLYQEYKRSGLFGKSDPRNLSRPTSRQVFENRTSAPLYFKHDSGIGLDEKRPTLVQMSEIKGRKTLHEAEIEKMKRQGKIFLDPPIYPYCDIQAGDRNLSSNSATYSSHPNHSFSTPKNSRIKTSSLINIRKAFTGSTMPVANENFTYKTPTRRDLQKQQKLVKRVSNLEVKLNLAKRQLAMASNGLVDNDLFQTGPSQEKSLNSPKKSSISDISRINSVFQNYQLEHGNQVRKRCRRAASFDTSPQKLSLNHDSHRSKLRNRSSSWNNKPLPSEPTQVTDHLITRIDKDLLTRNVSYFSDSDSEELERFSKDRDFFQKFPYRSRKNKDDSDYTHKKMSSLFPSKDIIQASPLNQVVGKKLSLIKRLSKEITGDEKKYKTSAEENSNQLSPKVNTYKVSANKCTYETQLCENTSHHRNYSDQNFNKLRPNSKNSNFIPFTAQSQISHRRNTNQLSEKNIPSLPPPSQIETPLSEQGDRTVSSCSTEHLSTRLDDCSGIEIVDVDTEEVIEFGGEDDYFDHDQNDYHQLVHEQSNCSPSPPQEEHCQPHNIVINEDSEILRNERIIQNKGPSKDHFEWPEDVF